MEGESIVGLRWAEGFLGEGDGHFGRRGTVISSYCNEEERCVVIQVVVVGGQVWEMH
jgi:hypothetical protein